ncbi:MAG: hypothetical protein ACFFCS_02900 [Candidatus Hodarchaeota archaeon]
MMNEVLNEIFILNETGINLFSWSSGESNSDLLSGFLTALNMFAKSEKGQTMKELTLEQTTFVFEKKEDLIYVVITENEKALPLLKIFLSEMINLFERDFGDEIKKFTGNIAVFDDFTKGLLHLQDTFGINLLNDKIKEVKTSDLLQSINVISKLTGELLFTEATQFVNKEDLGFLVPLVVKACERVVVDIDNQTLEWILLISNKDRIVLLQPQEFIIFVEEYKVPFEFPKEFITKHKKLKNKFSDMNFIPQIKYIKMINNAGKVLEEFERGAGYSTKSTVDSTMVVNAANNFMQKYYKLVLKGIAIGDRKKGIMFVTFKDFFVLLRGAYEDFQQFQSIVGYIKQISE